MFERRKMALALRSGTRGGQRVRRARGRRRRVRRRPRAARRRARRHARRARRRRRAQRRRQDRRCCAVLRRPRARRPGTRWVGAGDHGRLPRPGGRPGCPATRPVIDALRAGRSMAEEDGGAAADGASCSTTSRSAPAGRDAQRRRAHAARVPAADAGRAELPACSTSRPTTSTSTRSRRSRTRSSATTAPSSRSPTTATSSTASPTDRGRGRRRGASAEALTRSQRAVNSAHANR